MQNQIKLNIIYFSIKINVLNILLNSYFFSLLLIKIDKHYHDNKLMIEIQNSHVKY